MVQSPLPGLAKLAHHPNAICGFCEKRFRISSNQVVCSIDGVNIVEHGKIGECPLNKFTEPASKWAADNLPPPKPTPEQMAYQKEVEEAKKQRGRDAWKKIHDLCATDAMTMPALDRIISGLGCGGCSEEGKKWIAANPLPAAMQKLWGWKFHNAINLLLGKKEFTYIEAFNIQQPESEPPMV